MPRTPEGKVEDYLVEQSAVYGALVRKLAYVGRRGAPDRMVVWPTGWRCPAIVDFVELKAPGKKPTPQQEREHLRIKALGIPCHVADNKEHVDTILTSHEGK